MNVAALLRVMPSHPHRKRPPHCGHIRETEIGCRKLIGQFAAPHRERGNHAQEGRAEHNQRHGALPP
jgi:hypothetical protein